MLRAGKHDCFVLCPLEELPRSHTQPQDRRRAASDPGTREVSGVSRTLESLAGLGVFLLLDLTCLRATT